MDPAIRIIRAAPADVPRIAPLLDAYRVFYGRASDPAAAAAFLGERLARGESAAYLAVAHEPQTRWDDAAGFVQLYPSFTTVGLGPTWVVNDLFVTPEWRGKGVGRALLEAAEEHGRRNGAVMLSLLTARDNAAARRLYGAAGWTLDESYARYTRKLGTA